MQSVINWEELGIEVRNDRRQESRLALSMPIEVTGFDIDGKFFTETTRTIDVSKSGCGFALRHHVDRGGIIAIKIVAKNGRQLAAHKPLLYQVARSNSEGPRWITGAAKLQSESLWSLAFSDEESVTVAVS